MGVSLSMMLLRKRLIQVWFQYAVDSASKVNNGVEIRAQWPMDKLAERLWDCTLLKVFPYLDISFFLPGGPRFFKAGMQ